MHGVRVRFSFFFLLSFALQALAVDQGALQQRYDDLDVRPAAVHAFLNPEERQALLKAVDEHPVAKLAALAQYDPPPGGIGFCFGRAMAAHLLARQMGLERRAILKLFAAGNMQDHGTRWRFHVTTLVLGEDGRWYTIDPVMVDIGHTKPMLPGEWIQEVEKTFVDKPHFPQNIARYYITDPDAVMVDMRVVPATLGDENNERIIETGFSPERPGFELERQVGDLKGFNVYRVDDDAAEKYLLRRHSRAAQDEFNFNGLDIVILREGVSTPLHFEYHDYFRDLFATLP